MKLLRNTVRKAVLLFLLIGVSQVSLAQVRLDGQVYSMVYGLENSQSEQQWDYFQGFNFRLRPATASGLSFKTNFRLARRGDPGDWDEKVYNAYLDWRNASGKLGVRAGRQFVYRGVITGSLDAISVKAQASDELSVQVIGGVGVSWDRSLDLQSWDDGGVLGAYAIYRVPGGGPRIDASYVQRRGGGETVWQQAGSAIAGVYENKLYYHAELEYNLKASTLQGMRYRLTYQPEQFSVSGEFISQKPRVVEDSFFNIFQLESFNQVRVGASYRTTTYQLGLRLVHTMYTRNEASDEVFVIADHRIGSVGVVYKTGFGGDNIGVFGDVKFSLIDQMDVGFSSSYYNYERRSIAFDDNATAFSAGIRYRPIDSVLIQTDLQESMNRKYNNDLRVLFRISYLFSSR